MKLFAIFDPSGIVLPQTLAVTRNMAWQLGMRCAYLRTMYGNAKQRRAYAAGWRCHEVSIFKKEEHGKF